MQKTILEARLPTSRFRCFIDMKCEISNILKKASSIGMKNGFVPAQIILFGESYLRYKFDISHAEVLREIELLQNSLPSDIWCAVGFSVNQLLDKKWVQNSGYLFTSSQSVASPKRMFSEVDMLALEERFGSIFSSFFYRKNPLFFQRLQWELAGNLHQYYGDEFQKISSPSGIDIELRVCLDAIASPISCQPNTLTLVPAHNLDPLTASKLSQNRLGVIINDSGEATTRLHTNLNNFSYQNQLIKKELNVEGIITSSA